MINQEMYDAAKKSEKLKWDVIRYEDQIEEIDRKVQEAINDNVKFDLCQDRKEIQARLDTTKACIDEILCVFDPIPFD
ncbi:hypothetical protein [Methanococcoides burtonii]|nr:hypothetical protein [Methanococcoides burtonii]